MAGGLLDLLEMLRAQGGGQPGAAAGLLGLLQAGINPNDQTSDMAGYTPGQSRPGTMNQIGQAFNGLMPQSSLYPGDQEAARGNLDPMTAYKAPGLLDSFSLRPGSGAADRMGAPPIMPQGGPRTYQPPMGGQAPPQSPMVPPGDMGGYSPDQSSPFGGAMAQMPPRPQSAPPLPPPQNIAALPQPGAQPMQAPPQPSPQAPPQQPPPAQMQPPPPQQAGRGQGGLLDAIGLKDSLGSNGLLGKVTDAYGGQQRMQSLLLGLGGHESAMQDYLNPGGHNFDRMIKLRQMQLAERQAEDKPSYHILEDSMGNKKLVRAEPNGRSSVINPPGLETQPTNPYSTGKSTTEPQAKDQVYASRAFGAEKILRSTEAAATDLQQKGLSNVPLVGNYLVSKEFQNSDQAQRDFVNAILRRESGAAINKDEFVNARKQYFPQPGDGPEVIAQKRMNRQTAIEGIAGGGGPNYQPPATFGPNGELIERKKGAPATQQQTTPQQQPQQASLPPGVTKQQAFAEAQRAYAKADTPEKKAAIQQRLKMWGL